MAAFSAIAVKLGTLFSWTSPEIDFGSESSSDSRDLTGSVIAMADWISRVSRGHSTMIGCDKALKVKEVLVAIVVAQKIGECLTKLLEDNIILAKSSTIDEIILVATAGRLLGFSESQISFTVRDAWKRRTSPPASIDQTMKRLEKFPYKIASLCERAVASARLALEPIKRPATVVPTVRTLNHWTERENEGMSIQFCRNLSPVEV
jgi:2-methylcitrate dehydratase PrpD